MGTSVQLAVATLRGQSRRLVSVLLAVVMGVAFVAMTLTTSDTFRASITRDAAGPVEGAAAAVTVPEDGDSGSPTSIPAGLPGALTGAHPDLRVRAVARGSARQDLGGRQETLVVQSLPRLSATTTLAGGRLPQHRGEIALTEDVARGRKVAVGSVVRLAPMAGSGAGGAARATVVGLVRAGRDSVPSQGMPVAFAADQDVWAWTGESGYQEAYVDDPGRPQQQVRDEVAALPQARGLVVRTADAERRHRVDELTHETAVLTGMLLVFAVVAVTVAALVVANTFAILVAQRTRQLALLRAIGAERRQVRASVLVETLVVGLVGSVLGTALGLGLTAGLVLLSHGTSMDLGSLSTSPVSLVVPLVVGVLVTLVAGTAPARAATRVAPLAALRPQSSQRVRRATRARVVLGTVLAVGGAALLGLGARHHELLLGVPGGLVSFVGVLALGPVLVPALARVVGALPARLGGVPGGLAVDNSRRNPGRASATAGALLVGVTLITMTSVGAATAVRSADDEMDRKVPVDATVSTPSGLTVQDLALVRRSGVVRAATLVGTTQADVRVGGREVLPGAQVTGMTADASRTVRRQGVATGLDDATVLLPPTQGVGTGDQVVLVHGDRQVPLRADVSSDHVESPVVSDRVLARLDPQAHRDAWVRLTDDRHAAEQSEQLGTDLSALPGVQVEGAAAQRAEMQHVMDVVLGVVTGLLAVSVLIALVGIGNTLSLSVLERTQESGLLRALGLTRRQLRATLGWEALTLAGVGTALGLVLGTAYGLAGACTLFGGDLAVVPQVPWLRLVVVAAVALAAGWLASVVPARRACRVSPSAALATE